jgi:hypothetical protein
LGTGVVVFSGKLLKILRGWKSVQVGEGMGVRVRVVGG